MSNKHNHQQKNQQSNNNAKVEEKEQSTVEQQAVEQEPVVEKKPVAEVKVVEKPTVQQQETTLKYTQTKMLAETLKSYVENMAPNHGIDTATGIVMQRNLIAQLTRFLPSQDFDIFREGMNLVVKTVKENIDGCFSKRHVFRFIPNVSGVPKEQVEAFKELIVVIQKAAETNVKQASQMFDMTKVVSNFADEKAVTNITRYFS